MKTTKFILVLVLFSPLYLFPQGNETNSIDALLTDWHNAAASIDQNLYFSYIDDQGIYIGTDSTEIWTKQEFYDWSTPHFEKKKTWSFKATQRHIYMSDDQKTAWFDELIDYGKGTLRGSGVLQKRPQGWRIMQYVLSVPVPNDKFVSVMDLILAEEPGSPEK